MRAHPLSVHHLLTKRGTTVETRLTKLFGIKHPILSAPMANHSGGRLAGAVSAAGALGTLGAAGQPVEWPRGEIALAGAPTGRPVGVGFLAHPLGPDPALFGRRPPEGA